MTALDPAEAFDAGTVMIASGIDHVGRLWTATAIVDERGDALGAFVDCEAVSVWEGTSLAKARAIVAAHCD